tara:strand:+ start:143 stop:754 length:612 start_codon:yes stop_codon:yes gene_type:complete
MKKDFVSNSKQVKRKLRRTTTTSIIHDTNSMFGKQKKLSKRDKYLYRLGKKELPGYPIKGGDDDRQCLDCCTMLCAPDEAPTAKCYCSCNSVGAVDSFGCSGACFGGGYYIPGGWDFQYGNCEYACAQGGSFGFDGYETSCHCSWDMGQCDNNCWFSGGCGGGGGDNPPAQCPEDYVPEWTAGGQAIHVPGCNPHEDKGRHGN